MSRVMMKLRSKLQPNLRLVLVSGLTTALFGALLAMPPLSQAKPDFPVPSSYPISWELKFKHGTPARIAVAVPGQSVPKAYWYMTYTVTNDTKSEQKFYPQIDLLTADGNVHASGAKTPDAVFDAIKSFTRNKFLEPYTSIDGPIRLGPAEARDGVAIWEETQPRMDHFSVFVTGLSGEAVIMKMVDGKLTRVDKLPDSDADKKLDVLDPQTGIYDKDAEEKLIKSGLTILRKTLQLNFFIRGDEVFPGEDEVNKDSEEWIMR